jgi:hypothetical protein
MKKLLYTTMGVICSALLIAVLWAPTAPASAQGTSVKDPSNTDSASVVAFELFGEETALTCLITCSNGDYASKTVETRGGCLDACEEFCEETCHLLE